MSLSQVSGTVSSCVKEEPACSAGARNRFLLLLLQTLTALLAWGQNIVHDVGGRELTRVCRQLFLLSPPPPPSPPPPSVPRSRRCHKGAWHEVESRPAARGILIKISRFAHSKLRANPPTATSKRACRRHLPRRQPDATISSANLAWVQSASPANLARAQSRSPVNPAWGQSRSPANPACLRWALRATRQNSSTSQAVAAAASLVAEHVSQQASLKLTRVCRKLRILR